MTNFEYLVPTKILFGKGTENEAGRLIKEFGGHTVLIHWGGDYVRTMGLLDRVHKGLEAEGISYVDLDGVVPNPRLSLAKRGVELCKQEGVDFVLAIGGGSAIDSAKAIAYGLVNDFDLEDLFLGKASTDKIAKIGAISTLAGTGSETSNSTVINIDTMGPKILKRSYNHECARPLFAVMNPELTYSLPPYQTAAPGADIMMHTMERYFTTERDVELTDEIAEGLLRTVKTMVPEALAHPTSYTARANLLLAGAKSHDGLTGLGRVSDFACHAIEHEMGAMFDVAHGAGLTAIWSSWAKYVIHVDPERFAQFAVNVWGVQNDFHDPMATGLRGIEAWDQWCHAIGMPTSLHELGIDPTDEQIREMAEGAVEARGGDHAGNFMQLHVEDIVSILKSAR
ncbi:MAG: iron-containing alcohol dehydrogenase [Coriobacteriaceae bacterium]|uniref:iron-containing alcohol dehydrogenase n=1 Tax=Tractidigestivibacter sp. TaxID=2847320 RepID=UPI002A910EFD|nr:iron-containing alcohol dehydrogenase [Tractidigestivibacter sp.]MCI6547347.1 iron-containing alcohol dehydrogenase [Coriobacteriaceae bacterium]MDY5271759.1 iron-containing alcohol dehydrogenase [Tractidigestivibacter sp.]